MNPANNPPITAATITAAVVGLLAAFTTLDTEQVAAIGAAVGIIAAVVAQRFTTPYLAPGDPADHADHGNPEAFHDGRDVL
jgi:predicted exporter